MRCTLSSTHSNRRPSVPPPHHTTHSLSRDLTHLEAEIFIADYVQAEAVHNMFASYSEDFPTGLKILDGVVDTAMGLKQQVPIDIGQLRVHCAEDIGAFDGPWMGVCSRTQPPSNGFYSFHSTMYAHTKIASYCPDLGPVETRVCLNDELGSRVLSHACLKIILPRGGLDVQIPNLSRFGRGFGFEPPIVVRGKGGKRRF